MKRNNSFTTEQIGYFEKPMFTEDALRLQQIRTQKMKELGIKRHDFGTVGPHNDEYTDDEKEALRLIYENREVPQDLADRIKRYNSTKKKKPKYKMKVASPELIRQVLGIKEKDQW